MEKSMGMAPLKCEKTGNYGSDILKIRGHVFGSCLLKIKARFWRFHMTMVQLYKSEWENDKKNGRGIYVWAEGQREGIWKDGQLAVAKVEIDELKQSVLDKKLRQKFKALQISKFVGIRNDYIDDWHASGNWWVIEAKRRNLKCGSGES